MASQRITEDAPPIVTTIPKTMRAWVFADRGLPTKVLKEPVDIPVPSLITDTSLLVRVSHVALHPGSVILMSLIPIIFRTLPCIAETDFSGTVVAVGSKVPAAPATENDSQYFTAGTPVFGSIPVPTYLKGHGALAEYVVVEMDCVARKPEELPMDCASGLVVSAITAVDIVDLAKLKPGQKVLINSPCGGVGSFATQLIRHSVGPSGKIVGICSASSSATAVALGCDETIDYNTQTNGQTLLSNLESRYSGDQGFDRVVDCHGSQDIWHAAPKFLKPGPGSHYATVGPKFTSYSYGGVLGTVWKMILNSWTPVWAGGINRSYKQAASFLDTQKLDRVRRMAEERILRTEISSLWKFEDALKAYEALLTGHARGKVVISVGR